MIESLLGLPYKIKVLLDRLTPDRAAKLDNVNDTITSRAPASSAVSNAVLTDARVGLLDNLVNIASAPARIKSIQRGTVTVSGGATFASVTLGTTVDPSKSIVFNLGSASVGNNISNFNIGGRLQLVDGTTVRGWSGGGTNAIEIGYQVVEFW